MPNQELQKAASLFFNKKPPTTLVSKGLFDTYNFATEERKQITVNSVFRMLAAAVNNIYYDKKDERGNPYIYDCFVDLLQDGNFTCNVQRVDPATHIPLNNKSIFCYYSVANGPDFLYSDQLKTPKKARNLIEALKKIDVIQTDTPKELEAKAKESYEENRDFLKKNIKPSEMLTIILNKINFLHLEEMFQSIFNEKSATLVSPFLEEYKCQQLSQETLDNINTPNKPYMDIISDIFTERQGVIIGHAHFDIGALKDLAGNLEKLRSQGVKTLFIEEDLKTKYVYEIFNKNGNIQSLKDNIDLIKKPFDPSPSYFDSLNRSLTKSHKFKVLAKDILEDFKDNTYKIYEEAQRLGIKLVPMDNHDKKINIEPDSCDDLMAYNILQDIKNDEDKFIILVGNAHTQLSNRLDIPMLEIFKDIKKDFREYLLNHLKTRRENNSTYTYSPEANIHIACDISDIKKDRTASQDEQENQTKITTSQEQNLEQIKAERDIFQEFIIKNHGQECLDNLLSQVNNKQPSKTPQAEEETTLLPKSIIKKM